MSPRTATVKVLLKPYMPTQVMPKFSSYSRWSWVNISSSSTPSAWWSSTSTQPLEVYSGYRSNSPASMAGWMLLVPPPTPLVISTS